MYITKKMTTKIFTVCMVFCLAPSVVTKAQVIIYRDPTHRAGESEYIKTTKELIKKINKSATATAGLYTVSAEEMKQVRRLKEQQYHALTTAYAFYTDELRIERFYKSLETVKTNMEKGLKVIEANPQASYFFRDKMMELIAELDDAETVFKQATIKDGKNNQMTNADRNMLLFKAEDMVGRVAKEGQGLVNVGKMITLDPEKLEQLAREKNRKEGE